MTAMDDESALTQVSSALLFLAQVRRGSLLEVGCGERPPLCQGRPWGGGARSALLLALATHAIHPRSLQGGDKAKEASLIFKDLIDRAGSDSVSLTNGLAASYLAMRRFEDAEKLLLEAHGRAPGDVDTLVNLVAVTQQLGKAAESNNKWLPALREAAAQSTEGASHPYLAQLEMTEGMFERVAASFAVA